MCVYTTTTTEGVLVYLFRRPRCFRCLLAATIRLRPALGFVGVFSRKISQRKSNHAYHYNSHFLCPCHPPAAHGGKSTSSSSSRCVLLSRARAQLRVPSTAHFEFWVPTLSFRLCFVSTGHPVISAPFLSKVFPHLPTVIS